MSKYTVGQKLNIIVESIDQNGKAKFKVLSEASYKKGVNNKTLKEVMLATAKLIVGDEVSNNVYEIHHLDYDNSNNNISNISLMPKKIHQEFHRKAKKLDKNGKDILFNNTDEYKNSCIKIGEILVSFIKENGKSAEKDYPETNQQLEKINDFVIEKLKDIANVQNIIDLGDGQFKFIIKEWYTHTIQGRPDSSYLSQRRTLQDIKKELEDKFNCTDIDARPESISGYCLN